MTESQVCCSFCRGQAPYHFCRNPQKGALEPGCTCHQKQDAVSRRRRAELYKDHTADKAIGNVMREAKK